MLNKITSKVELSDDEKAELKTASKEIVKRAAFAVVVTVAVAVAADFAAKRQLKSIQEENSEA